MVAGGQLHHTVALLDDEPHESRGARVDVRGGGAETAVTSPGRASGRPEDGTSDATSAARRTRLQADDLEVLRERGTTLLAIVRREHKLVIPALAQLQGRRQMNRIESLDRQWKRRPSAVKHRPRDRDPAHTPELLKEDEAACQDLVLLEPFVKAGLVDGPQALDLSKQRGEPLRARLELLKAVRLAHHHPTEDGRIDVGDHSSTAHVSEPAPET